MVANTDILVFSGNRAIGKDVDACKIIDDDLKNVFMDCIKNSPLFSSNYCNY